MRPQNARWKRETRECPHCKALVELSPKHRIISTHRMKGTRQPCLMSGVSFYPHGATREKIK